MEPCHVGAGWAFREHQAQRSRFPDEKLGPRANYEDPAFHLLVGPPPTAVGARPHLSFRIALQCAPRLSGRRQKEREVKSYIQSF